MCISKEFLRNNDNLFEELLEDDNYYKDLLTIIHYIVPRVRERKFKDEDGKIIENKFGYFKNAILSNINKLNIDIEELWGIDRHRNMLER